VAFFEKNIGNFFVAPGNYVRLWFLIFIATLLDIRYSSVLQSWVKTYMYIFTVVGCWYLPDYSAMDF